MIFFRPRPRTFSYTPRFYREDEDPERRIHFRRKTLYDPRQRRLSLFTLLLLFVLVLLLIGFLIPRLSSVNPEKTKLSAEDIVVTTENSK